VLLYIVVAVTAAPDNHVGTRIFISGFMLGPMWLAIAMGAIVVSRLCNSSSGSCGGGWAVQQQQQQQQQQ
jgi:hypothetical protein